MVPGAPGAAEPELDVELEEGDEEEGGEGGGGEEEDDDDGVDVIIDQDDIGGGGTPRASWGGPQMVSPVPPLPSNRQQRELRVTPVPGSGTRVQVSGFRG